MAVTVIHPGEHLSEELEALGISSDNFAQILGVSRSEIKQILNGQRSISGDTALRLAKFFGTSSEFWTNLERLYWLRNAQGGAGSDF